MSTDQTRPEPTEPIQPIDATQPIDVERDAPLDDEIQDVNPTIQITDSRTTELPTSATPTAVPDPPARPTRPSLRVGTIVWGLVLAVIGAGVFAVAVGAQIDIELALIGLLVLAGVALLAGSIATSIRRRSH